MKKFLLLPGLLAGVCFPAVAQTKTPGEQMLESYHSAEADALIAGLEMQGAKLEDDKTKATASFVKLSKAEDKIREYLYRGAKYQDFTMAIIAEVVVSQQSQPVGANAMQITQLNSTDSVKTQIVIASQNAIIIEQNNQMLVLLQKIADKK